MNDIILPVNNNNVCPEGQRICGNPDYNYFKTCMPKSLMCPINDIRIVKRTAEIDAYIAKAGNKLHNIDKNAPDAVEWQYLNFDNEHAIAVTTSA